MVKKLDVTILNSGPGSPGEHGILGRKIVILGVFRIFLLIRPSDLERAKNFTPDKKKNHIHESIE